MFFVALNGYCENLEEDSSLVSECVSVSVCVCVCVCACVCVCVCVFPVLHIRVITFRS